jgi:hypothetical protein
MQSPDRGIFGSQRQVCLIHNMIESAIEDK